MMKSEDDKLGFCELRVRPRFIFWMLVILIGIPTLSSLLQPGRESLRLAHRKTVTSSDMRFIAKVFMEDRHGYAGLPLSSNGTLHVLLLENGVSTRLIRYLDRTNAAGELLDVWKTPFRFEPVGTANLIIRSAGPNRQFGDKNDIVFNCASNSLVKP